MASAVFPANGPARNPNDSCEPVGPPVKTSASQAAPVASVNAKDEELNMPSHSPYL